MCQLAAESVDLNCLGVSFPETGHLRPYDKPLRTILDANDPVVMAGDEDAQWQAAASKARARLPEFVLAFEHRRPKQVFAVKKLFRDGDKGEWMWVQAAIMDADVVEGT
jgi:uncharacterized protein YegJ (DUF2314 family)